MLIWNACGNPLYFKGTYFTGHLRFESVVSLCESKVKSYCRGNTTIENNFFQKKPKLCNVTMSPIWKLLTFDMQNETTGLNESILGIGHCKLSGAKFLLQWEQNL